MKKLFIPVHICIFIVLTLSSKSNAQNEDSLKNYWLNPVEINARRINLGEISNKISKDNLENIFSKNGFNLIRKGVFFAQDIYADGLKKGDINVVIDGERYHSACPNRMDSPLTRINPLELESVDLSKNTFNVQSGLGGLVSFNRSTPSSTPSLKAELSALGGAQSGIDFAASGDYEAQRISLRFAQGSPFVDGEGNSFMDSYNYQDNYNFKLAEGSIRGKYSDFSYGASFSYTDNVSFPYLLMDERVNRVYSAHFRYNQHKIYFNFTDHMMDNNLRISPTLMRTDVTNLTIGAIGDFYEVVYRNWNSNNFFKNPKLYIANDLMPDVNTYLVNLFKSFSIDQFQVHSKLGISYKSVGETSRKSFYEQIYNNVDLNRVFPLFSLGVSYLTTLSDKVGAGIMAEVNSESPETETLFIAVEKPGTKPAWSGNPNLQQPIKTSLRGSLDFNNISFEVFGSQVWNYNNLVKKSISEKKYLTFENVDAYMFGTNIFYDHENLEINASYIWAKNTSNESPLSEIPPLSITTKIISPMYHNFIIYAKHTYNDAQLRIDELLNESSTPAWNRIDLGFIYSWSSFNISVDIDNILNQEFYQHLSYLRDPFSSMNRVYEPGRVFRVTFKINQIF